MKLSQILQISLLLQCVVICQKQNTNPFTLFNNEIPMDVRLTILNVTNSQNCTASSPINQIKYNNTQVTEIKFADFCTDYSSRTCCSNDNLNSLRLSFYRQVYLNQDLSIDCQQILQRLVCYDCDGDVGQGLRKGMCPQQCEGLYEIYQNTQAIKVCSRSDIMCSQLSNIVTKKTDFCKLLGHEINENNDYEEWFYQFYSESPESFQQTFKPVCWNFLPSSHIFGPATSSTSKNPTQTKNKNDKQNPFDKFNQKYSTLINILYIILAFIIVIIVVFIAYYCLKSKGQQQGRRIGGQTKNHHID